MEMPFFNLYLTTAPKNYLHAKILLAATAAPKPLSMLTTEIPAAQLFNIASNAASPLNDAP